MKGKVMKCKNCGLDYEGNFCPRCGAPSNFTPPPPQQKNITRHKNQIRPGMFNINPSDHAYIDEKSNFHISKTGNYTEYPKDIDQIRPGMFKLPSEDKNNK